MQRMTEARDAISGRLCTFHLIGAALVAESVSAQVRSIAPTLGRVASWTNDGFASAAYKALRAADLYTESTLDPNAPPHKRRYRLIILPQVTADNREELLALRRVALSL